MSSDKKDRVFRKKAQNEQDFSFNKTVTSVFNDMLNRSVPFYGESQRLITELSVNFAQSDSCIYDLGCSNGNTCLSLFEQLNDSSIKIIGIDNSEEMIQEANARYKKLSSKVNKNKPKLLFKAEDIENVLNIERASVVILCLTLQFIRPRRRLEIIKNIYKNLAKGGVLILHEKNVIENPKFNRLFIKFYYDLKERNGYTKTEIQEKRVALENILIPYTKEENIALLREAGFKNAETFFQWYNFSGTIAVKD
ncbi:MAG: carboxy-S-adenosyl-L-methionine synthase CmoA [Candidatus Moraniibacteriota bacterium]